MSSTTTIPGELFLLLTNDAGRQSPTQHRRLALAAAAITELVLRERIGLDDARSPRIAILDPTPTGEPDLDAALEGLARIRAPRLRGAISSRHLDITETVGDALAEAGAVHRRDGWLLTSWPAADDRIEAQLRARLGRAVSAPESASVQDVVLLELLVSQRVAHRVLKAETGGMSRRELERIVGEFRFADPAARALRGVIDATSAALIAATAAAGGVAMGG